MRRAVRQAPLCLAVLFFAVYCILSVCRYHRLATLSWDLGIFEQAVRHYARLEAPVADLKGPGTSILGDHFSPVIALVAPFYRIFPSPVTLLVVQSLLFAVSVLPVGRAAVRVLGQGPGLAVATAYGLSWGVQRAVDFDFHEIAFAVPLLAFCLEAVLRERFRTALAWAAPLVLVKEDMGATVAVIGLVVLLRACGGQPRVVPLAAGTVVLGLAAVAVTVGLVIPAFNPNGTYDYWAKVGGAGMRRGETVPPGTAVRTLLWLLVPTSGMLAVRSPLSLVALPTVAWRFASHDDHYWGVDWHYSAVLMPILCLALVDALRLVRGSRRGWLRRYAAQLPAGVAAGALALSTVLPVADLTHRATYLADARVTAVERLLARIPDGATVEANVGPISRLASRCRVFWTGDTRGMDPDYVALDNASGWAGDPLVYARRLHPNADYEELASAAGFVVLHRTRT